MNQKPLVSVIIPTYNREKYIKKSIESVIIQTYKNIEVIIIDDGSKDSTFKIVTEYQKNDPRITIIKNKINLGFPKSLNKGIGAANGKYIARIDDDDSWLDRQKLEKQINFLEIHPDYVLVGGGGIWLDENGKEIVRYLLPEKDSKIRQRILFDNCFIHSSVVFRKNACKAAGGYNEKFGIDCDWGLWLELGKLGKFYNFQDYFICYTQGLQNISNFNIKSNLKNKIEMRRDYRRDYPGYQRAFLLGWLYYLSSFLPYRKKLRFVLIKIRSLIFGRPSYK